MLPVRFHELLIDALSILTRGESGRGVVHLIGQREQLRSHVFSHAYICGIQSQLRFVPGKIGNGRPQGLSTTRGAEIVKPDVHEFHEGQDRLLLAAEALRHVLVEHEHLRRERMRHAIDGHFSCTSLDAGETQYRERSRIKDWLMNGKTMPSP